MHFPTLSSLSALLLAAAAHVSAHGYIDKMWIDGVEYQGYQPWQDPYYSTPPPRINREFISNYPTEDVTSIDIQCGFMEGNGSRPALLSAPATAGKVISLKWTDWPDSHHGSVATYMARCPADCSTFRPTATDKVWFKIHHEAQRADWTWATDDFMPFFHNGTNYPYNVTIPASLKKGNYILRHEILSLHSAYAYPGIQAYPSCIQLSLKSKGTSSGPTSKISIPGPNYMTPTSPGTVFSIYDGTGSPYTQTTYPIPGPAVWLG
ncbi:glycoside hydrolase family 61 protein [Peziza echinospora]|nr:glycoside hydrolase family 61 protein [Peziza echinospora]